MSAGHCEPKLSGRSESSELDLEADLVQLPLSRCHDMTGMATTTYYRLVDATNRVGRFVVVASADAAVVEHVGGRCLPIVENS